MLGKYITGIIKDPLVCAITRSFAKKNLKKFTPETYLETKPIIKESKINDVDIKIEVFEKRSYIRGLAEDEKPIPVSPKIGPIRVLFHSELLDSRSITPNCQIKCIVGVHVV
jgi:hypothetical protein